MTMKKMMALALASAAMVAGPAEATMVAEIWGTATLTRADYRENSWEYGPVTHTSTDGVFRIVFELRDIYWGTPESSNLSDVVIDFGLNGLYIKGAAHWAQVGTIIVDGPIPADLSRTAVQLAGTGSLDIASPWDHPGNVGSVYSGTITSAWIRSYDDPDYHRIFITAAIPEPATWAMMIAGFGLAGAALRSRRRVRVAHA